MIKQICLSWSDGREEGTIQVEVVYSARRTLGLEVKADGSVLARVPRRMPDQAVKEFVEERREWIVEKWFLMQDRRRAEEERGPRDYEGDPALERWYREQARKRIAWRTAYFARHMGVTYGRISIRAAKTRWGSCSAEGNLNFHWKLILMPPEILDYVVVHELAHRKEMNHSDRFWAEVERVLPDYRQRRAWLKEHGREA